VSLSWAGAAIDTAATLCPSPPLGCLRAEVIEIEFVMARIKKGAGIPIAAPVPFFWRGNIVIVGQYANRAAAEVRPRQEKTP
jgi:hypothetical protein